MIKEEKYPRVTTILSEAGLTDFSKINPVVLEASAKFGTAVHLATKLWDETNLNMETLSAPLLPSLEAWKKFKRDYGIICFVDIEKHVISKKWKYQGHLDRIAIVYGERTLIDIKSVNTVMPATAIQTAGYKIGWEETSKQRIRQRWCVQVLEDGYKITEFKERTDESVFIACLQLYRWKE